MSRITYHQHQCFIEETGRHEQEAGLESCGEARPRLTIPPGRPRSSGISITYENVSDPLFNIMETWESRPRRKTVVLPPQSQL